MASELAEVLDQTEAAEAELEALRGELDLPELRRRVADAEARNAAARAEVAELLRDRRMALVAALFGFALLIAAQVLAIAVVVTRGHS